MSVMIMRETTRIFLREKKNDHAISLTIINNDNQLDHSRKCKRKDLTV